MATADELAAITAALVRPGHGLLAADESVPTIGRRFAQAGLPNTPALRTAYRDLLLGTPGIERFLSGVILHEETATSRAPDGQPFVLRLSERGILPGIKLDQGTEPLPGFAPETVSAGLDGLAGRIAGWVALGLRFAKWRAVLRIGPRQPSSAALLANTHVLARYAACCQAGGLVPIVEPEVLMDGDHDLAGCAEATTRTLEELLSQLDLLRVDLRGLVLKANMVVAGLAAPVQPSVDAVAEATVAVLRATLPPALGGIVFLSGGQTPELATHHLDAIARRGPHPWPVSFSFARALQEPVLAAWGGREEGVAAARRELVRRAHLNAEASMGAYAPAMEAAPIAI